MKLIPNEFWNLCVEVEICIGMVSTMSFLRGQKHGSMHVWMTLLRGGERQHISTCTMCSHECYNVRPLGILIRYKPHITPCRQYSVRKFTTQLGGWERKGNTPPSMPSAPHKLSMCHYNKHKIRCGILWCWLYKQTVLAETFVTTQAAPWQKIKA